MNYYEILGVDKTATDDDIKKAYRKLAMKHHPDRGGDQTIFQQVQEAYSVLSDPNKRMQYDNPQPQPQFHHFNGGMPPGFEDLFRNFAFNFQFGGDPFQRQPRNRNLNLQTTISLEDAFYGKEVVANITLPNGRENIVNVKIPPGIHDGNTLRLKELGDDTVPGAPRGDVHLTISVLPHNVFQRSGDDLHIEQEVSALDAITGIDVFVNTIDNKTLKIHIQEGTQHGTTLVAQGYGMPNLNDSRLRGRLFVKIKIVIPKLTDYQKTLIQSAKNCNI